MFENRILFLTLQILVSFADSQILANLQPWSYKSEQGRHFEGVKQYHGIHQPLTVQTQIQSISAAPKYIVSPSENKVVTNPVISANDNIPNSYDNIVRKYDSMTYNPNVANNYCLIPPENHKRSETNHKNRKYKDNGKRNKGGKKRRKKENTPSNDKKERAIRQYRQGDEYKNKKTVNELLGNITLKNNERMRKLNESYKNTNVHENDVNESVEIENLRREERYESVHSPSQSLNKNLESLKQKLERTKTVNDKEPQNLSEKEKLLNFSENQSVEDIFNVNQKYSDEEHRHTRNLNSASTIEYQTKYTNPQDEFNKYLESIMNGNVTNLHYYTKDIFPYSFDSFYKTSQAGELIKPKNKDSKKRRNPKKPNKNSKNQNKERKNENDECNTVIELSPTAHESTPITISTGKGTPKDIYLNLKIKKNNSPSIGASTLKTDSNDKHEDEYLESSKESDEELYHKPLTISLYEPMEDNLEYYPDFTLLNYAYLTSSEEEELNMLQKNNYNYVQNEWDYYADKVKSYVEQSNKKQSHMKSHTGLESPDLLTTIVNKKEKQSLEKSNSNINKNVETIYAPSRVASYNQPEKKSHNDSEDNMWFKEGDTTVVLSRSLDE